MHGPVLQMNKFIRTPNSCGSTQRDQDPTLEFYFCVHPKKKTVSVRLIVSKYYNLKPPKQCERVNATNSNEHKVKCNRMLHSANIDAISGLFSFKSWLMIFRKVNLSSNVYVQKTKKEVSEIPRNYSPYALKTVSIKVLNVL